MKNYLYVSVFLCTISMGVPSYAQYPGFDSGVICNGYNNVVGVVDLLTASQTYGSTSGMYVRVKDKQGRNYGGVFYYRKNTDAAYKQMTTLALTSLVTKLKVRMCYNGNDVYALELRGYGV